MKTDKADKRLKSKLYVYSCFFFISFLFFLLSVNFEKPLEQVYVSGECFFFFRYTILFLNARLKKNRSADKMNPVEQTITVQTALIGNER